MGGPGNQTHYPGVASAMLYLQRTIMNVINLFTYAWEKIKEIKYIKP
jgi:hypothetical protein